VLKAELQYARIRRDGLSLRERLFSSVDRLGRLGCAMPMVSNALLESILVRKGLARIAGISAERPLPHYARNALTIGSRVMKTNARRRAGA